MFPMMLIIGFMLPVLIAILLSILVFINVRKSLVVILSISVIWVRIMVVTIAIVLSPFIIPIIIAAWWIVFLSGIIVLSNLFEARRLGKTISYTRKLLTLSVNLIWTFSFGMLTCTYGAIDLFFFGRHTCGHLLSWVFTEYFGHRVCAV